MTTEHEEMDASLKNVVCVDADDSDHKPVVDPGCMRKVFENDMLLEMILKHVLYPVSLKSVDRRDLWSMRLVKKSWVGCVGDILRKNRDCLFRFELNQENSVDGTDYCNENGKLLKRINSIVSNPVGSSRTYKMATFGLRILPAFFRNENYEDLAECLEKRGHGLTDLDMSFPLNDSMALTFGVFTLPKLARLSVEFSEHRVSKIENALNAARNYYLPQTVYPLQTILNATSKLTKFQLKGNVSENLTPVGFGFVRLPNTIEFLCLDGPLKSQDLEILLRNDLPNLRLLRLLGTNNPFKEGLIFQILSKFRTSLESLGLTRSYYINRERNAYLLRLPVMEKLETMYISPTWELHEDAEEPINWGTCLPNIKNIKLFKQTEGMFTKWIRSSTYTSVTQLDISLINNDEDVADNRPFLEHPLTFDREKMLSLHLAFPNVTTLEIAVCGSSTCGLKYLFMEMRNLQHLAIVIQGSRPDQLQSVHWDALLIGVPEEMATYIKLCLQKNPNCWTDFPSIDNDENYASIRMLTDLKSLALVENFDKDTAPMHMDNAAPEESLISDLPFVFGFLKMPKLDRLLLTGQFMSSAAMVHRWKQEKGSEIHRTKKSFQDSK